MALQLQLQNFSTLVQGMAAAVEGACKSLVDLTVGSVVRVLLEANASVALWLQWLLVLLMQRQRLATSQGDDIDSWVGDFGLTRLPAVAAIGTVTLSRFVSAAAATVPVGTELQTGDGSQKYTVVADPTNQYWNATANGYVLPSGTSSIDVPIVAETAGSAANVQAGAISLFSTATSAVDTVSNANPLVTGIDSETDAALQARFPNYIASLSKATPNAVDYAIESVQQGILYAIATNSDEVGGYDPGHFVITIDDGTGNPSASLKSAVYAAVDLVRPIGSGFSVQSPTVRTVDVSLTITAAATYDKTTLQGPVEQAISAYIADLPIGGSLAYLRVAQLAYDAVPGVASVSQLLLAGGTSDITAGPSTVLKPGTVAVN